MTSLEASIIVDFNNLLRKRLPNAQLLWQPSTSNNQYRCSVLFNGNVEEMVETVVKCCSEQDLIILTGHGDVIYFK